MKRSLIILAIMVAFGFFYKFSFPPIADWIISYAFKINTAIQLGNKTPGAICTMSAVSEPSFGWPLAFSGRYGSNGCAQPGIFFVSFLADLFFAWLVLVTTEFLAIIFKKNKPEPKQIP